jgi:hypothetical protein
MGGGAGGEGAGGGDADAKLFPFIGSFETPRRPSEAVREEAVAGGMVCLPWRILQRSAEFEKSSIRAHHHVRTGT